MKSGKRLIRAVCVAYAAVFVLSFVFGFITAGKKIDDALGLKIFIGSLIVGILLGFIEWTRCGNQNGPNNEKRGSQ